MTSPFIHSCVIAPSIAVVQSLSHVWLFVTPRTVACQASLSITSSWSLLKLMSINSVLPSNHLILKSYVKPRHCIKKQRHYFSYKGLYSQSYGFSSSQVWMWELNNKEGWAPKNGYFRTVVLETVVLESPLDSKEIKPGNPKENQPWIVTGRTDAEAPILWPPDVKSWLIGKDPDAGEDWRQEEMKAGDDRGWDGWMASIQWIWVWANSGR